MKRQRDKKECGNSMRVLSDAMLCWPRDLFEPLILSIYPVPDSSLDCPCPYMPLSVFGRKNNHSIHNGLYYVMSLTVCSCNCFGLGRLWAAIVWPTAGHLF